MKLSKPLIVLSSVLLITFGWIQEIYYYQFVFSGVGLPFMTCLIAGFSLSLLLGYFSYKRNYPLFIVLLIFSIIASVLGQNTAYSAKQSEYTMNTVENTELQQSKQRYIKEIERVNSEIELESSLLPKTIEGRANWATKGVKPIEEKIARLKSEKQGYESELQTVINKLSTGNNNPTLFEQIAEDIPFISATVLQYTFMSFMSLFIALMAPAGITMLSTSKPVEKKKVKKQQPVQEKKKDKLSVYIECRYAGQDKPVALKSRKFVTDSTVLNDSEFNSITKKARTLGLIASDGNKTVPLVSRSQFEMLYRNKSESVKEMRG